MHFFRNGVANMAKLLNNTARVIAFGGIVLIPSITAECKLRQDDLAQYPALANFIESGDVEVLAFDAPVIKGAAEEVAEELEIERDFEEMSVAQLKAYAHDNGIDLGKASKKKPKSSKKIKG